VLLCYLEHLHDAALGQQLLQEKQADMQQTANTV
jgi:hypothetical protein